MPYRRTAAGGEKSAFVLLLVLTLSGCIMGSPGTKKDTPNPGDDVREKVIRFLIEEHGSGEIYSYCVSFEKRKEPDRDFLRRFKDLKIIGESGCYVCAYDPYTCRDEGPRDRETGRKAMILRIKDLKFEDNATAEVWTETFCGGECSYQDLLRLKKKDSSWEIVEYEPTGIS